MAITVVTTSQDKKQTKAFLDHLGFPFKKADVDVREVSEKKKK